MASKSQEKIWRDNAEKTLSDIRGKIDKMKGGKKAKEKAELKVILPMAREYNTAGARNDTYLDVFKERIRGLMMKHGLEETHTGDTFVMLQPCLTLGQNESGKKRYDILVEKYGKRWTDRRVTQITRSYPDVTVRVKTRSLQKNGRYKTAEAIELLDAHADISYVFVGEGKTLEKLKWTETLGNKLVCRISEIPERYKKGEERNCK